MRDLLVKFFRLASSVSSLSFRGSRIVLFLYVDTMFSQCLYLNRYTQIPQTVSDDGKVEEQGNPALTSHVRYQRSLNFLCLIALGLVFGVAGFIAGIKTARFQIDRPIFSDTITQGLFSSIA